MVHGFALDPELVASWGSLSDYRHFSRAFGIGTPRLMAEYPSLKNWRRQVLRAVQSAGDIDRARVTELVVLLSALVVRRERTYDGMLSWLENAEEEHRRQPFHAILAPGNPRTNAAVITGNSLGVARDPRWDLPMAATPERRGPALASALSGLLGNCRQLVLVDPHFGPENPRHRRVFEALVCAMTAGRLSVCPDLAVEVHTSDKAAPPFFDTTCRAELTRLLPGGLRLRLLQLKERDGGEKLHQRYVLTELGGVRVDPGLDDGSAGETFDVNLMGVAQYSLRWAQHTSAMAFDVVGNPVEIEKLTTGNVTPSRRA